MSKRKLGNCPLFRMAHIINSGGISTTSHTIDNCIGKKCEWWYIEANACSFHAESRIVAEEERDIDCELEYECEMKDCIEEALYEKDNILYCKTHKPKNAKYRE